MNFAKFVRTPLLQKTSGRLLLSEVKASTIEKCFVKCGFSVDLLEAVTYNDNDHGEFCELQCLIKGIVSEYTVDNFLRPEENAPTSVSVINATSSIWKEDLRSEVARIDLTEKNHKVKMVKSVL